MYEDSPEGRLEQFAQAMADNDASAVPIEYMTDEPTLFVEDIRAVLAKAKVQ